MEKNTVQAERNKYTYILTKKNNTSTGIACIEQINSEDIIDHTFIKRK